MEQTTNEIILERLNNFIERNSEDHSIIKETLERQNEEYKELMGRVKILEEWKLVFVAKYSVYSGIALFFGSVIATIAVDTIKGYLTK